MVNIAVLGYGTVGSGVVEVIEKNHEKINRKAGDEVSIRYVLDTKDFPGNPVQDVLTHDFEEIVNDPSVNIVCETLGGLHPAYEFTRRLLEAGKSVCSSNKELVAHYGTELIQLARDNNVNYMFEASCGGGIPIIRPLNSSLTADEIEEITGILNGTTNYILTRMADGGCSFEAALKEAQENGYAEKDPAADVEGDDACRKIAILSSLAYGNLVDFEDIYTEGISKITAADISYARATGFSIKLLATSRRAGHGFYAMVAPVMIDSVSPLFSVSGVFNAIFIRGNVLGDVMFYGSGAGKLPTASAVLADVVDCAKHLNSYVSQSWSSEKLQLIPIDQVYSRFFVRVAGSLAADLPNVREIFGDIDPVSIPSVGEEFGFLTGLMTEAAFQEKAARLPEIISRIRVRAGSHKS